MDTYDQGRLNGASCSLTPVVRLGDTRLRDVQYPRRDTAGMGARQRPHFGTGLPALDRRKAAADGPVTQGAMRVWRKSSLTLLA
jgi:hypothetical protein